MSENEMRKKLYETGLQLKVSICNCLLPILIVQFNG